MDLYFYNIHSSNIGIFQEEQKQTGANPIKLFTAVIYGF
jgi:hypothetical protein